MCFVYNYNLLMLSFDDMDVFFTASMCDHDWNENLSIKKLNNHSSQKIPYKRQNRKVLMWNQSQSKKLQL